MLQAKIINVSEARARAPQCRAAAVVVAAAGVAVATAAVAAAAARRWRRWPWPRRWQTVKAVAAVVAVAVANTARAADAAVAAAGKGAPLLPLPAIHFGGERDHRSGGAALREGAQAFEIMQDHAAAFGLDRLCSCGRTRSVRSLPEHPRTLLHRLPGRHRRAAALWPDGFRRLD